MDILDFVRMVLALAVTVGLIGLAAFVAKRYAPDMLARLQARRGAERRMKLLETLVLDPTRRLVLVRVDEEERLILLGEGRELIEPRPRKTAAQPKPDAPPPPPRALAPTQPPRPKVVP